MLADLARIAMPQIGHQTPKNQRETQQTNQTERKAMPQDKDKANTNAGGIASAGKGAKRTEPRVHCYQRPIAGGYATSSATTPEHLRAVFEAERQRLATEKKPRRKRRQTVEPSQPSQLQLVA
jgi:hypothetical protein